MKDLFTPRPAVNDRIIEAFKRQHRQQQLEYWARITLMALSAFDLVLMGLLLIQVGGAL